MKLNHQPETKKQIPFCCCSFFSNPHACRPWLASKCGCSSPSRFISACNVGELWADCHRCWFLGHVSLGMVVEAQGGESLNSPEATKKKKKPAGYVPCQILLVEIIGILIMVYCNPHITRHYNPQKNTTQPGDMIYLIFTLNNYL